MLCAGDTKQSTDGLAQACASLSSLLAPVAGVHYRPSVASTNTWIKELALESPQFCCLVAVAGNQTAGRGTRNRSWTQLPDSDLAASFAFKLDDDVAADPRLSLAVGALTAAAIRTTLGTGGSAPENVSVKWPNDVLLGEPPLKCCGILLERSRGWLVAGCGVNVNSQAAQYPAELRDRLTTLRDAGGRLFDRGALLIELAGRLLADCSCDNLTADRVRIPPGWLGRLPELVLEWSSLDRTMGTSYRLLRDGREIPVVAEGVRLETGALICRDKLGNSFKVTGYTELERN